MRRLASDPPAARALGEKARASVAEHHAPARRVPFVRTRVDALREGS
jgi:hypothetical protein